MNAAWTAPESESPPASKVAESAALLAFAVMMGPVGLSGIKAQMPSAGGSKVKNP
jgi:hypothetical protein